jgi:biotin operon repressor
MRSPRKPTIIVVGGALAIASVAYGLGTQADDGTAVADSAAEASKSRDGGRPGFFMRAVPPGFDNLADELGVDADELQDALRDFHDQEHADRREELSAKLAKALGISQDKVEQALEALDKRMESRRDRVMKAAPPPPDGAPHRGVRHWRPFLPLRQLANELDVTRAELRKALRELRPDRPGKDFEAQQEELVQFLADRFDLDVDKVTDALGELRPPVGSRHRPGLPDHPPGL